MIQKVHLFFFVYLLVAGLLFSQENSDEILAKIGERRITVEEFRMRYELMPQINRHVNNSEDERKAELLYTMISEKLWAEEAKELGLDSSDIMKYTYKALEKMYIRDALYTQEIKSKAEVKNEDYLVGALRGNIILNVNYIYSESEDEIWKIYKQLQEGAQFDSLLSLREEYLLQEKPYQVTFGRMEEFVEDSIFKLNIGEYTSPLKSPEGWYIFKLISSESVEINNAKDAELIQKNIKNTVEMRATDRVYDAYWNDFFKNLEINADGDLFWRLAEELTLSLRENKTKNQIPEGEKIVLGPEDFYGIEKSLGNDILNSIFIKFPSEPVTLKEFLYDFAFEGFFTTVSDTNGVAARLNSRVKRFIERELLAREGYKKEMYSVPEVKASLDIWKDNYLATLFRNHLLRSVKVSDNEVLSYYQKKNEQNIRPLQVNIVEVLTDSLEVIEKVLNELDKGADLKDLARKYTKREWAREKGGEFGLFNVTEYGEIGRIAADMEIGEIYGPLSTDEGFSIFELVDKKENNADIPESYEEIKNELRDQLRYEKASESLINSTVEAANKYGVSVNEEALKSLNVTNVNMIVYRYMGFGGRILAVPLTSPFYQWVEPWKKSQKALP